MDDFLNSRTLHELGEKLKNYYHLPSIDDDDPKYGEKWQHFEEVKDYNAFFDYQHNTVGFRDTEIQTNVDICYYGCSMTYGIGVPVEARWTNVVDRQYNFTSNNFSVPGIGIPEIANLFLATNRFIKMKYAVFLLPDMHRFTFPIERTDKGNKVINTKFHPNFDDIYKCKNVSYVGKRIYSLPDVYFKRELERSIEIIVEIARLSGIKIIIGSWAIDYEDIKHLTNLCDHVSCVSGILQDRRGRDAVFRKGCEHPGINAHREFADSVIESIRWIK